MKTRVLYIEDNQLDLKKFELFIRKLINYELETASCFKDGKKKIESSIFDVIITDFFLEDGTAFDILELQKATPVIVISGKGNEEIAVKAIKAGAKDYLIKDSDYNYLTMLPVMIEMVIKNAHLESDLVKRDEELKKLSIVASFTNNSIMIFNNKGITEWVNPGFTRLTGYTLDEISGTTLSVLRRGENTGNTPGSETYEKLMKEKKPVIYEAKNYSKSGQEYWVLSTLTPILDELNEVTKIIAIDSNITDRKKMEIELLKAKDLAEKSVKLQENFLANMSHEIRTPMNAIIGFSELLSERKKLGKKEKEYIDLIKSAGNNLLRVINDILDISKIEAGMMTIEVHPFSISEIFKSVQNILMVKAKEKKLKLIFNCDSQIPETVLGDQNRLTQIILNIAGNAIKFTRKGSVDVTAQFNKIEKEKIFIKFFIKDTGIGIPKEKLDSVFERFKQAESSTARDYGGTGLGLNIAKQLIDLQQGNISVESEVGKGSVFTFNIPYKVTKNILQQGKTDDENYNINELRKLKILLVEDNPLNIKLVTSLFSIHKLNLEVVVNGKECVDLLLYSAFDIILIDIEMPVMNGYEATTYIRKELLLDVPIVALTAHAMSGEREKCLKSGMNEYISKPINSKLLFETMYNLTFKK